MSSSQQQTTEPFQFYDPHFHIWECEDSAAAKAKYPDAAVRSANCPHNLKTLGGPGEQFPIYLIKDYEKHLDEACSIPAGPTSSEPWAVHVGSTFVEALPTDGNAVKEATWVFKQIVESKTSRRYQVNCRADFLAMTTSAGNSGKENAATINPPWTSEALSAYEKQKQQSDVKLVTSPEYVGVRQILNFEPSWPYISENLFANEAWLEAATRILQSKRASDGKPLVPVFDLQINPHQMNLCVDKFVLPNPQTKFVLNHLGLKRPADSEDEYWEGMQALAKCPNVYVKLSDPTYGSDAGFEKWDSDEKLLSQIHTVIKIFGPERCMLASNYPVNITTGACTPARWMTWVKDKMLSPEKFSRSEIQQMMALTAMGVYCEEDRF